MVRTNRDIVVFAHKSSFLGTGLALLVCHHKEGLTDVMVEVMLTYHDIPMHLIWMRTSLFFSLCTTKCNTSAITNSSSWERDCGELFLTFLG